MKDLHNFKRGGVYTAFPMHGSHKYGGNYVKYYDICIHHSEPFKEVDAGHVGDVDSDALFILLPMYTHEREPIQFKLALKYGFMITDFTI